MIGDDKQELEKGGSLIVADDPAAFLPSMNDSLKKTESELITDIVNSKSKDDLDKNLDLFNMNVLKRNLIHKVKLETILEKAEDQMIERMNKGPGKFSNKELLEYVTTISTQIDRLQNNNSAISEKPAISVVNTKQELNINVSPKLDRDGKERVLDALQTILRQAKNASTNMIATDGEIIDSDQNVKIIDENNQDLDSNNVYLNEEE